MSLESELEIRSMVAASGQVLCEHLPANFNELDEEDMDDFVVANAWQPFENWDASQLWDQINSVAHDLMAFHKAEQELAQVEA